MGLWRGSRSYTELHVDTVGPCELLFSVGHCFTLLRERSRKLREEGDEPRYSR